MRTTISGKDNQQGFALISAILLLFAATILGLMVMNSSDMEVLLSGAQQRYENNFNVSEGAASVESAAIGSADAITWNIDGTDYTRTYAVVDPGTQDQILSPKASSDNLFDPGDDMSIPDSYTINMSSPPDDWPMDNLMHSAADSDDPYDYHYRSVYKHATNPPKGYDATKFSGYLFQISAQRTTEIEVGGSKVGPKATH